MNPLYRSTFWTMTGSLFLELELANFYGQFFMNVEKAWSWPFVSSWEGVKLPINVSYSETLRMWGCSQGCFWWFDNGLHTAFWLSVSLLVDQNCISANVPFQLTFTFISYHLIFPSHNILKSKSIFFSKRQNIYMIRRKSRA